MNPFDLTGRLTPPVFAPQMPMVDMMNVGAFQNGQIAPTLTPQAPTPGPGFDWMGFLQAAGQMAPMQSEPAPMLQPPGLYMPNIQIQPYQLPALTALGGFGGLLGG